MQIHLFAESGDASGWALSRLELREHVRLRLVQTDGNVKRTARETGVPEATVRRWRNAFGIPALGVVPRADYEHRELGRPKGERERVRRTLSEAGGNVRHTSRATGVPASTVRRWRDEFKAGVPTDKATASSRTYDPWESAERQRAMFFARVDKTSSDRGCWLWMGATTRNGYGRFGGHRAHRYAYEAEHGPLDAGRPLHHQCKTKTCVNPSHLLPAADASAHARLEKLEKAFIAEVEAAIATA
jgi:transposase-like protein